MTDGTGSPESAARPSAPPSLPLDSRMTFNPDRTAIPPAPVADAAPWPVAPPSADRLELRKVVGRGGFGEVWEAVQVSLGRVVAAKRLRRDLRATTDIDTHREQLLHSAFRWEALTSASLEHPNIVPIYDLGADEEGRPVLAMKYVRGTPWPDAIAADFGEIPVPEFLARHLPILAAVAQAVAFAHSRGIVHRDLKPSQVMVGEFGEVLLMDWGLAVAYDPAALAARVQIPPEAIPTLATATSPAGTPAFMAPEQTDPTASRIGPWTDVYLLGGTLYYLLTGETPHTAENSAAAFYEASEGRVTPPREKAPAREVPPDLEELAMRAMRPDPKERIPSVRAFIEGIQGHISGANRRREAEGIAAGVRRRIDSAHGDYRLLSDAETQLQRALTLWPDLPGGGTLRDRILATHASAANDHGDLMLARVLGERIADASLRGQMLGETARLLEGERARERQRRRLMLGAAIVPLVILLLSGLIYRMRAGEQLARALAESTRERALRAEQGQTEQAARARLFERMNDLRRSEADLAERMARAIPSPEKFSLAGQDAANTAPDEAVAGALIGELARQRRERELLEGEAPGALGEEPFNLRLAEANYEFARARTDARKSHAYELYGALAAAHPERPEPETGLGLSAYFSGEMTSATLHLASATRKTADLFGADSQRHGEALELQARVLRDFDFVQFRGTDLAQRAVDVLDDEWTRMTVALAGRYRLSGDVDKSMRLTSAALELLEAAEDPDPLLQSAVSTELGGIYFTLGRFGECRRLLEQSVQVLRSRKDASPLSIVNLLNTIGDTHKFEGNFEDARRYYDECRRIADASGNFPIQHRALYLNSLAGLERRLGRHEEALRLYEEALRMLLASLEPGNPLLARAYANIGPAYTALGRNDDAERAYDAARRILDAIPQGSDFEKAVVYSNLGQLRYQQQRPAEALPLFEGARASLSRLQGADHPDVATVTSNIAFAHYQLGDHARAQEEVTSALRIRAARLRPRHPDIAAALAALGQFRGEGGDQHSAIPLLAKAALDQEASIGMAHRDTRVSLSNLITALHADGRAGDARRVARWLYLELATGEFPRQPPDAWRQAALFLSASRDAEQLTAAERIESLRAARHLAGEWPPAEARESAAEGALRVADAITSMSLMRSGPARAVASGINQRACDFLRAMGYPAEDPRVRRLAAMAEERGLAPLADAGATPTSETATTSELWAAIGGIGPRLDWEGAFPEVGDWSPAALGAGLQEARRDAIEVIARDAAEGERFLRELGAP